MPKTPAFVGLLDTYSGAAAAYSLRRLSSTYTGNLIRVRRSSDNAEQNIGYDSNNVLDTASLLNFVGYNLFTYSEDISQSQYTKQQLNTTGTPAYLNVETAPDGTLTADKLIENTVNSQHTIYQSAVLTGFTPGIDHNVSVYLKSAERTAVKIFCDIDGVGKSCIVDLTNGSVSSSNFVISPVVTSVGNGWYRFSVTQSSNTFVANFAPRIFLLNSSNQDSYLGDGTSGVYVWGFQLTRTSSVQTYSKTAATANAGDGFVTTWYDQSGNANNATNSTAIAQPQIVSSGAMILINGKPSVQFDGSNDQLNLGSVITAGASSFNSFVAKRAASGDNFWALSEKDATGYLLGSISNTYYYQPKTTQYQASSATDTTTNQLLITGQNNAGTMSIFKNGSTITSTASNLTYSPTIDSVGRYSGLFSKCNIQETIFYNTNQSTNRTGIESNINTFYTIY